MSRKHLTATGFIRHALTKLNNFHGRWLLLSACAGEQPLPDHVEGEPSGLPLREGALGEGVCVVCIVCTACVGECGQTDECMYAWFMCV